jgi:beta-lactam-binding protein with PASTA domain
MPTPPEYDLRPEDVVVDETVETAVTPPPPVPPPVPAPGYLDPGYPVSERVVVDDPSGTRVVTRETPPPLPPDEDPRRGNWLTPTLVFICLAALGIVLAAILLGQDDDSSSRPADTTTTQTNAAAQPSAVQVPSVVGQSRSAAETALRDAGFVAIVARVPGPPPVGQVLAQNPRLGDTATEGGTVRINISDGSQTASGATATTQAPETSTTGSGTGASSTTSTPAGTAQPTQTQPTETQPTETQPTETQPAQTQTTAPEPTTVSVPTVSGDVKAAAQRLASAGLLVSIQYVPSDEPLGTVVAQSPAPGSTAQAGAHVTLNAASGPGDKEQRSVPDASGQSIPEAVETMNAAGLRLIMLKKTVTDQELAGEVVEQTPRPGAEAPRNAQVLVYMGAYKG